MRTDLRTHAIRLYDPDANLQRCLGLSTEEAGPAAEAPLVRFSNLLCSEKSSQHSSTSDHPICTALDFCINIAAAPDHLLTGLIVDVLNVCFRSLRNKEERVSVEIEVIENANVNNLPKEGSILKFEKG